MPKYHEIVANCKDCRSRSHSLIRQLTSAMRSLSCDNKYAAKAQSLEYFPEVLIKLHVSCTLTSRYISLWRSRHKAQFCLLSVKTDKGVPALLLRPPQVIVNDKSRTSLSRMNLNLVHRGPNSIIQYLEYPAHQVA